MSLFVFTLIKPLFTYLPLARLSLFFSTDLDETSTVYYDLIPALLKPPFLLGITFDLS